MAHQPSNQSLQLTAGSLDSSLSMKSYPQPTATALPGAVANLILVRPQEHS